MQGCKLFARSFRAELTKQSDVDLPMSHQDIADHLGLSIETVSRTITELERACLIERLSARTIFSEIAPRLHAFWISRRFLPHENSGQQATRFVAAGTDGMGGWHPPTFVLSRKSVMTAVSLLSQFGNIVV